MTVTVAVDANGADLGPCEVAQGAALAAAQGIRVRLFGPAAELYDGDRSPEGVEIVDAPQSIAKDPDPAATARSNPDASVVRAARAVATGEADAFVSAGSTGAAVAAGLFNIKRAKGIYRPALALPVPVPGAPVTLVDVGANVEVRAEHLIQFAFMGAALVRVLQGIERPRVGVLSNGEEATRGTPLVREAHAALGMSSPDAIDFVGSLEGNDVTAGTADVIVTDGFTGNVTLKVMEGVSDVLLSAVRERATASPRARIGGLLLRPALRGLRDEIDPEAFGGAYLLGLRSLGVVPHGRFSRRGFAAAIVRAAQAVDAGLVARTSADLEAAGALRRPASGSTASLPA